MSSSLGAAPRNCNYFSWGWFFGACTSCTRTYKQTDEELLLAASEQSFRGGPGRPLVGISPSANNAFTEAVATSEDATCFTSPIKEGGIRRGCMHPQGPDDWLRLGEACVREGKEEAAVRAYLQCLLLGEEDSEAAASLFPSIQYKVLVLDRLGELYFSRGAYSLADACYRKATQLVPNSPHLHYRRGVVMERSNNLDRAVDLFQKASALGSPSEDGACIYTPASFNLAALWRRKGHYAHAVAELKRLSEHDPQHQAGYVLLADCLEKQGKIGEALQAAQRAHEIDPDDFSVVRTVNRLTQMLQEQSEGSSAHQQAPLSAASTRCSSSSESLTLSSNDLGYPLL